jgi:hypothetical protein
MTPVAVDVHTHLGQHGTHVCDPLAGDEVRAWGQVSGDVSPDDHQLGLADPEGSAGTSGRGTGTS